MITAKKQAIVELTNKVQQYVQAAQAGISKAPLQDSDEVRALVALRQDKGKESAIINNKKKELESTLSTLVYNREHGIQDSWPARTESQYQEYKKLLETAISKHEESILDIQIEVMQKTIEVFESVNN